MKLPNIQVLEIMDIFLEQLNKENIFFQSFKHQKLHLLIHLLQKDFKIQVLLKRFFYI